MVTQTPSQPITPQVQEITHACYVSRQCHIGLRESSVELSNHWVVKSERVNNMPRGGPMSAWKYVYFLITPEGTKWGGYYRQDSFAAWAKKFMEERAAAPQLYEALKMLYEETADYIRVNHLGDVHHNQSMKLAQAAIAAATGKE